MDLIAKALEALARQRPLFHSEADFQHAFAWQLHNLLPNASIRLEVPISASGKVLHVDIWIVQGSDILAIELKYKTRTLTVTMGNEPFTLSNHSALDQGRYDFIKDIQRLEQLARTHHQATGYAILLTNDGGFWAPQRSRDTADAAFRLHEGRALTGMLTWSERASQGTKRSREASLYLQGTYDLHWHDYSHLDARLGNTFRYLAIQVVGK